MACARSFGGRTTGRAGDARASAEEIPTMATSVTTDFNQHGESNHPQNDNSLAKVLRDLNTDLRTIQGATVSAAAVAAVTATAVAAQAVTTPVAAIATADLATDGSATNAATATLVNECKARINDLRALGNELQTLQATNRTAINELLTLVAALRTLANELRTAQISRFGATLLCSNG
jgi:septal ring factor EnvC (AmiA/AmiB activator)